MFLADHNLKYAYEVALNGVSSPADWTDAARAVATLRRWKERVIGAPNPSLQRSHSPRKGRAEGAAKPFVVQPLDVPSVVRPDHEPRVLYVRLTAQAANHVSVLPRPGDGVEAEIAQAQREGRPVARAVLVGADSIVDPRAVGATGHHDAVARLVEVVRAFVTARVPFVWRTRGGIDGALPIELGEALAAAGPLAVVELGVPTLDGELCDALEGHSGVRPEHRLRLASALVIRGVAVRGLVDPLVPMLTDQQQALEMLCAGFADAGVARMGVRYIVLTRERARAVASRLGGMQRALLQGVFADEPWHKPDPESGQREVHKRIPGHLRRAGHHRLVDAGARHGVHVDILDPVLEGEDLSVGVTGTPHHTAAAERPTERARAAKRARPQLDLFRKAR